MKKRVITILAAVTVAAVLATACGKSGQDGENKGNAQSSQQRSEAGNIEYKAQDCVTLGDYQALQISVPNTYEVTTEQIEDYAQRMAQMYAQPDYKDTDKKKVEDGDTVNIDYVGKKDGEPFENGSAKGDYLTIGSHNFIDGFEEGLIGKKVGETVDLNLRFPDVYDPNPDLAGAEVVFTVTINKIVEAKEFKLTDKFVQKNLNVDSVKEYKKNIKSYLETANESSKQTDTVQAVTDKLAEICKVELPDGLLEARVDDYVTQFKNRYCTDTTLEEYLEKNFNGMTEEEFIQSVTSEMKVNLPVEMILEVIAQKENITLDEDKYQSYVKTMMENNNYETEEEFYKANGVNAKEGEAYARKLYVCNLALENIIDQAEIKYGTGADKTKTDDETDD